MENNIAELLKSLDVHLHAIYVRKDLPRHIHDYMQEKVFTKEFEEAVKEARK